MPPIAEFNVQFNSVRSADSYTETKDGSSNASQNRQNAMQDSVNSDDKYDTPSTNTQAAPLSPPTEIDHTRKQRSSSLKQSLRVSWIGSQSDDVEDGVLIGSYPNDSIGSDNSGSGNDIASSSDSVHRLLRDTTVKLTSPHLRSNLTREQNERDPLFFYEVVKILGAGSMGSVAKVRKRQQVVGGSARKDIQDAVKLQQRNKHLLSIPCLGGLFRLCIDDNLKFSSASSFHNKHKDLFFALPQPTIPGPKPIGRCGSSILIPTAKEVSESLGNNTHSSTGSFGSIAAGGNVANIEYAMKSIHLSRVTDKTFVKELKNEISILKALDHPHIVRAIETFAHRNQIFVVMELCSGGDLYTRDPYTEDDAARIISCVLSAIRYMHSRNICHRDLKYENILFVNDSPKAEVKLIDFGLSKLYVDKAYLTDGVGTIYTMAPEVLKGKYSEKADIWSVGVIAFMLLSSQMPFFGRKRRQIVEQIMNCQFDFRGRRWKRISEQAKNFIEDLLVFDPDERLDAATAMSSVWLNRRFAATTRAPRKEEETLARQAMLRYAGYTKLKKMALMIVAHKSTSEEIGILRKVFQKYDSHRDGSISYDEFAEALKDSALSPEDLRTMFDAVDLDGSGRIRYTEFLAATIEAQGAISEQRLAEAFDRLDSDDSGFISVENLAEMLGDDFPREEIYEIIREVDLSNDNQISYSEFLALWEQKQEVDRFEALEMLGGKVGTSSQSTQSTTGRSSSGDSTGGLSGGPDGSITTSSWVSSEERQAAEARATFLMNKRNQELKQADVSGPAMAITTNDINVQQQGLTEESMNNSEEGIYI